MLIYEDGLSRRPWRIWKLIPVEVEGSSRHAQLPAETVASGSLPSYDGDQWQTSALAQHAESEHDEFGTVITEVTVVTTRKKYRVDGAQS